MQLRVALQLGGCVCVCRVLAMGKMSKKRLAEGEEEEGEGANGRGFCSAHVETLRAFVFVAGPPRRHRDDGVSVALRER